MTQKQNEKERAAQLKELRRELEAQMEQDLAENLPKVGATHAPPLQMDSSVNISPKRILEALLFASGKPLTVNEIQKIVGADPRVRSVHSSSGHPQGGAPTSKEIQTIILELKEEYNREGRSFELIEIAGGYEMVTRKEYSNWLARLELQKRIRQASRSALETLAILAYKQPVTRAEIEELRGVDIAAVLSTLLERGFIKIVGKKEVPGRPFLYGTTDKFLEHFGLKSIKELPPVGEIKTLIERAVKKEEIETPPLQSEWI